MNSRWKDFYRNADAMAVAVIVVSVTGIFLPGWIKGTTTLLPSYQDETQWYLYRLFVTNCFSSGRFPLWCPYLYAGMNFAGWGHGSSFYPAGILFGLLRYVDAVPLNQWLHLMLGTLGLYYLARVISIRPFAACLAALWFGLGHLVPSFQEDFLPRVFVLAWCPWIYALLYKLLETRRPGYLAAAAICMGIQWLSGHIEIVVMQDLVIGVAFICLLFSRYRDRPSVVILFAAAFILGVMLGIGQFLPALQETRMSFRSVGFTYRLYTVFTLPQFWIEAWFFWLAVANLFTLIAVWYALRETRQNPKVMLAAGLVFFIFMMTFNWFSVLWIFYRVPLLNKFIPHGRMLPQAFIMIALLAGMGLDRLKQIIDAPRTARLVSIVLVIESVAVFIVVRLLGLHEKIGTDPAARETLMRFFETRVYAGCAIAVVAAAWLLFSYLKPGKKLGAVMLSCVFGLEFIPAAFSHLPLNPRDIMNYNENYERFFEARGDIDRSLIVYPFDRYQELDIPLQSGVLYGTHGLDAYITLSTLRYTGFLSLLDANSFKKERGKVADIQTPNILKRGDFISAEKTGLINLVNLKYVVSQNKNVKNATHYYLAYEHDRFKPLEGSVIKSGRNDLEIIPPAIFGLSLYFNEGDRLRFGLKARAARSGKPIILEIYEIEEPEKRRIIFRRVIEELSASKGMNFDLALEDVWKTHACLCVSVRPDGQESRESVILSDLHIYNPKKHFVKLNIPEVNVFVNPTAMNRAFIAHDYDIIPGEKERLEYMARRDFMPDRVVVLESEPGFERPAGEGYGKMLPGEAVLIEKYEPDEVQIIARLAEPGLLCLTDQYEPGWRVWVGAKEKNMMPADQTFRAVALDPGYNLVRFRYEPKSFAISLYLGIASWLVLISFAVIARKRRSQAAS